MSDMQAIRTALVAKACRAPLTEDAPDGADLSLAALRTMRQHLQMEVGYLSEFVGDKIVFRLIDAPGLEHLASVGDSRSLSEVYCGHILAGDLPELIPETHDIPLAKSLSITHDLPIRAHVSVPIERSDGSPYGMFCCLSPRPNPSLNPRDLDLMRLFARLAQSEVQRNLEDRSRRAALESQISDIMEQHQFDLAYQPIVDLRSQTMRGLEALCRFHHQPYRPPNLWFADAARVNMEEALELAVISRALEDLPRLPETLYMSLNTSPATLASGRIADLMQRTYRGRVVFEITEHLEVEDWAALGRSVAELREKGARIAIDDAGAGFAGLNQIVRLRPDIIKLDRSLVAFIDQDQARRSLCSALLHYASETGIGLIAEGIEREEERRVLLDMGVELGQGYLMARPAALDTILAPGKPLG